jgi:hypothetical protein
MDAPAPASSNDSLIDAIDELVDKSCQMSAADKIGVAEAAHELMEQSHDTPS